MNSQGDHVLKWLHGVGDKGDLFTRFATYGDDDNGTVWFNYIEQYPWPLSCYDTRRMALQGHAEALDHMTNYFTLLVAAQLEGKTS